MALYGIIDAQEPTVGSGDSDISDLQRYCVELTSVDVLGLAEVAIVFYQNPQGGEDGDFDRDRLEIRINTACPRIVQSITLLHEYKHACWAFMQATDEMLDEEEALWATDLMEAYFFKHNPKARTFYLEGLTP